MSYVLGTHRQTQYSVTHMQSMQFIKCLHNEKANPANVFFTLRLRMYIKI